MLRGDQLLAAVAVAVAVAAEPGASHSKLVRHCGSVQQKADGREQLLFNALYQALLAGKGLSFTGRHGRRQLCGRRLTSISIFTSMAT